MIVRLPNSYCLYDGEYVDYVEPGDCEGAWIAITAKIMIIVYQALKIYYGIAAVSV